MINAVGLVLHPARDCTPAIDLICSWANRKGATVLGLPGEGGRTGRPIPEVSQEELAERTDLIVSLGGDGTMLRAMRLSSTKQVPVLGVNLGKLGFLAEVDPPDLADALVAIDAHEFTTEPRSGLSASGGGRQTLAFNDVAMMRIPGHPVCVVQVHVEGHPFVRYGADAVIVATPTGSTAYSFSAGGPIVSPNASGLLVTPVAPHSAFNRALFLSTGEKLTLEILPGSGEVGMEADGQLTGYLRPGDVLDLTVVDSAAQVVRLGRTTFYQRAQRRLRLTGSVDAD
ncbi:NAD(+)/NADH kinase [Rugosimonospora acidiphila]|uniref:NAD kinase n=1 Tax=Rugosimonospora acidiphila TaxID=556531 RepID=A0ABP9SEC6_9ACTN